MPILVPGGRTLTNLPRLDQGISDLVIRDTAGGPVLYALSGPSGGVSAYALGAGGGLELLDFAYFPADLAPGVLGAMTLLDTPAGPHVVVAETAQTRSLVAYALTGDGGIGALVSIGGISATGGALLSVDQPGGAMLILGNRGQEAIRGYDLSDKLELSARFAVGTAQTAYASSVFAMETLRVGGADFLLGASLTAQGVSAYRIGADRLVATGSLGAADGIGIMTPSALASVEIGGRHFVLLGSAPSDGIGRSGAITVMELRADGSLVAVDHVLDTQDTRFGMIQSLEVKTAQGVTYVLAAGGDDGLSLFVMLPNGRLVLVDQVTADAAAGLENVAALRATSDPAGLRVFVASEVSAGLAEFSVDTRGNGMVAEAALAGGTLTGTTLDDILIGGAGDDSLAGGNGADILEDGAGRDTLSGGGGRDIFVLRADAQVDTIVSFERGTDRLDLSDWPFLYDLAGLDILPTARGAVVTWRNETLVIETMNGRSLSEQDVRAAVLAGPQRPPVLAEVLADTDLYLVGTAGADQLQGGAGQDTLLGEGGADLLLGGAGDDSLYGGSGNDRLEGESGADRLFGGSGDDLLLGNDGADVLWGDVGNDTLDGGAGQDALRGWGGNDLLIGGEGNDLMRGDGAADTLFGGDGNDRLWGGNRPDHLWGGNGDDQLDGQTGRDSLSGEDGNDTLIGGAGPDVLWGGTGDDLLQGDDLADRLFGEAGQDTLLGGRGSDRLSGGAGDDLLDGGDGNDLIGGNLGNDTLVGGLGNDRLSGNDNSDTFVFASGHGRDTIEDFDATDPSEKIDLSGIAALARITGYEGLFASGAVRLAEGGVLIATGGSNSIWLAGVGLTDLDDSDFIF